MAKKSKNKSKGKRGSQARGIASGLRKSAEKIPILGDIIKNPTIRKATAATGTVALLASIASLVPNKSVQAAAQNPTVRAVGALVLGDVPGVALQVFNDRNIIANFSQIGGGNGGSPMNGSV